MNIASWLPQDLLTTLAAEVNKQKAALDALLPLLEEIGQIDVNRDPEAAAEAVGRLQALVLAAIPEAPILYPSYQFLEINRRCLGIREDIQMTRQREQQAAAALVVARREQAKREQAERQEADKLRSLLNKYPADGPRAA